MSNIRTPEGDAPEAQKELFHKSGEIKMEEAAEIPPTPEELKKKIDQINESLLDDAESFTGIRIMGSQAPETKKITEDMRNKGILEIKDEEWENFLKDVKGNKGLNPSNLISSSLHFSSAYYRTEGGGSNEKRIKDFEDMSKTLHQIADAVEKGYLKPAEYEGALSYMGDTKKIKELGSDSEKSIGAKLLQKMKEKVDTQRRENLRLLYEKNKQWDPDDPKSLDSPQAIEEADLIQSLKQMKKIGVISEENINTHLSNDMRGEILVEDKFGMKAKSEELHVLNRGLFLGKINSEEKQRFEKTI